MGRSHPFARKRNRNWRLKGAILGDVEITSISRLTIVARTVERFPTVFNLLAEPDRVPIDTCVKLAQWVSCLRK